MCFSWPFKATRHIAVALFAKVEFMHCYSERRGMWKSVDLPTGMHAWQVQRCRGVDVIVCVCLIAPTMYSSCIVSSQMVQMSNNAFFFEVKAT